MAEIKLNDAGVGVVNTTLTNTNSVFVVNVAEMSSEDELVVKEFKGRAVKVISAVRADTGAPVDMSVDDVKITLDTAGLTDKEITVMYMYL